MIQIITSFWEIDNFRETWTDVEACMDSKFHFQIRHEHVQLTEVTNLTSYYSLLWRTLKWYWKTVLNFLDLEFTNSCLLYRKYIGARSQELFGLQVMRSLSNDVICLWNQLSCLLHLFITNNQTCPDFADSTSSASEKKSALGSQCIVCNKRDIQRESCLSSKMKWAQSLCIILCSEVYYTEV